jgi:prepilin-type N-terminal cleavage/methylation domain-containing protein
VRLTSTSRGRRSDLGARGSCPGFSLIELLVGLALALCLAAVAAPVWLSLERTGVQEGDRTVRSLQGRVAVTRFERDLRLASGSGCLFTVNTPVLEASASQVVFLERPATGSTPLLVEWETTGAALMRRWGSCPATRPAVFRHSLFRDHKTMLEEVQSVGGFTYVVNGAVAAGPIPENDLISIEAVMLELTVGVQEGNALVKVATTARIGR